jgi:hypothetical protein
MEIIIILNNSWNIYFIPLDENKSCIYRRNLNINYGLTYIIICYQNAFFKVNRELSVNDEDLWLHALTYTISFFFKWNYPDKLTELPSLLSVCGCSYCPKYTIIICNKIPSCVLNFYQPIFLKFENRRYIFREPRKWSFRLNCHICYHSFGICSEKLRCHFQLNHMS